MGQIVNAADNISKEDTGYFLLVMKGAYCQSSFFILFALAYTFLFF